MTGVISLSCSVKNKRIHAKITSRPARSLYQLSHIYFKVRPAISGVIMPTEFSQNINSLITFPNSFFLSSTDKFSSKNACHVPLQKLQYNAENTAAMMNHVYVGKRKIQSAQSRFALTDIVKDNFLPVVSANTDVGISSNQTLMVAILDTKTISKIHSQTCVYSNVATGVKNTIHEMRFIRF